MNKKQVQKIKKIMSYEGSPQQKRVLRQIKKQYNETPANSKNQFIEEVEDFFSKANNK